MRNFFVTGASGFIGSNLVDRLLKNGNKVIGIDNFDSFYDKKIKVNNLRNALQDENYTFIECDIRDFEHLNKIISEQVDCIIHLAAKAGVRPSILNPIEYQDTNIRGTQNLLEIAQRKKINKFIFASSSSVYGTNSNVPWSEHDNVLKPISPYAATKISGEMLGHVYSHLYGIQFLALRFFTVYGPRQRPDLAIAKFFNNIINKTAIPVFGDGSTKRDYTYIDDIVSGIINAVNYNESKYEIFNLGNSNTVSLKTLIEKIELVLNKKAIIEQWPLQDGDVPLTFADISLAQKKLNYNPTTDIDQGLYKYLQWLNQNSI